MAEGWRSIVMTGASGGIGRALAAELAAPGRRMLLVGRDPGRLGLAAEAAGANGAEVETAALDIRDARALAAAVRAFDAACPVDLALAGAGISAGTGADGRPEPPGTLARLVAVNLLGAAALVEPLLPAMTGRCRGRIALLGSLAAHRPLPDMAAYAATKAALRAWGTALRGRLSGTGVGVSVISPGFVASPMSARHLGPRPFEMDPGRAARRMRRGLERGDALITFPRRLAALAWLSARLPPRLSDRLAAGFAARILPDVGDPALPRDGAAHDSQAGQVVTEWCAATARNPDRDGADGGDGYGAERHHDIA